MTEEQKRRFDVLWELKSARRSSFDRRREFEWKVSFGVWTALATLIGFVVTREVAIGGVFLLAGAIALAVALILLHRTWQSGLVRAYRLDRDIEDYYLQLISTEMSLGISPELEERVNESKGTADSLKNFAHVFQLRVTFLLGLLLIIVSLMRTHKADWNVP